MIVTEEIMQTGAYKLMETHHEKIVVGNKLEQFNHYNFR